MRAEVQRRQKEAPTYASGGAEAQALRRMRMAYASVCERRCSGATAYVAYIEALHMLAYAGAGMQALDTASPQRRSLILCQSIENQRIREHEHLLSHRKCWCFL